MTTTEYLKLCKEIDVTISQLRAMPNPNKGLYWLLERDTITAPKTRWDKMIDELIEQKKRLKLKRDFSLRYGYGFAD
jgi:hypothetical protein